MTNPTVIGRGFANGHLGDVVDPVCSGCATDLAALYGALATTYPDERMALVSSVQDQVMRSFYGLGAADFETALRAVATDRLDPTARFRYFFVSGQTHSTLGNPAGVTQGGVGLTTWLTQLVTDAPEWAAIAP